LSSVGFSVNGIAMSAHVDIITEEGLYIPHSGHMKVLEYGKSDKPWWQRLFWAAICFEMWSMALVGTLCFVLGNIFNPKNIWIQLHAFGRH
jgi:hypothetical protein